MNAVGDVRIKLPKTKCIPTTEKSLRFIIILGNCFGLFPVCGIASAEQNIHFKFTSSKFLYSGIMATLSFCTLIVGVTYLMQRSSFSLVGESNIKK